MIIDFHVHTSKKTLRDLHVTSATMDDLRALAKRHNIDKMVLLATYFPLKRRGGTNNKQLIEEVNGDPLFLPFGSLNVENNVADGVAELADLAQTGQISGIKLYPGYQNFAPEDPKVFPVYELAQSYNLPVIIHTGLLHECCKKQERESGIYNCGYGYCPLFTERLSLARPKSLIGALKMFPRVKFVLAHLAKPYHKELRDVMRRFRNTFTDISGQFNSGASYATEKFIDNVVREANLFIKEVPDGEDRFLFASDFPIQSYADTFSLIERLDVSDKVREKIFSENAKFVLDKTKEAPK